VQHEFEHRHRAVARGEELARKEPQLPEAPGVQVLEQHIVDPALVRRHALKERLAARHGDDAAAYTAGKRELVGRVLQQAGLELGRR